MDSRQRAEERAVRVAPLPSTTGKNPYHDLFYQALEPFGVTRVRDVVYDVGWFQERRGRVDWVHIHFPGYLCDCNSPSRWYAVRGSLRFVAFRFRLRLMGFRIAWTCHNILPHQSRSRVLDWLAHVALAKLAHLVIVHSHAGRRDLARYFGRVRNVVHVPLGHLIGVYPNTITREAARRRLGLPEGAAVYLFLGYIWPYKGVEELIDAFRALEDPDGVLVLAGEPLSAEYRQALVARIGSDARIHPCFGLVADEDLQVYFNAADLTVLPFRKVLTSFSLMLSLSFGVPVLVRRIGSIIEYLSPEVAHIMGRDETLTQGMARAQARRRRGELKSGAPVLGWSRLFDWERMARVVAPTLGSG
ncbi:MAG: glycosyltransferase [Gemmatimonadales bacterium]|nr:glycosyltransferase [Gemmatimonadales bacterium]